MEPLLQEETHGTSTADTTGFLSNPDYWVWKCLVPLIGSSECNPESPSS